MPRKTIRVASKIFSVLGSETGQQSAPQIQLEMLRQSQHWNAERVLVENNFGITYVPQGDQSFP